MTPVIYLIPGSSQLVLAAAGALGPSVSADLKFSFPKPSWVTGLMPIPNLSGGVLSVEEMLAKIAITVFDENQELLISDGRGSQLVTSTGGLAPTGLDGLSAVGRSFRPFPLQRPGRNSQQWVFNVQNADAATIRLAGLYLYTVDP